MAIPTMLCRFTPFRIVFYNPTIPSLKGNNKLYNNFLNNLIRDRVQTITCSAKCTNDIDVGEEEKKQKRLTIRIPKITLRHPDNSVTITDLESAKRIAKHRNLELVKSTATKSDRETYELVSKVDFSERQSRENGKQSKKTDTRGVKLFILKSKIAEYDLLNKIKNINKVLHKNYAAKIIISNIDIKDYTVKMLKSKVDGTVISFAQSPASTTVVFQPLNKVDNPTENTDVPETEDKKRSKEAT